MPCRWLGRARLDVRNSLARCMVRAGDVCLPPDDDHPVRRLLESFHELSASRLTVEEDAVSSEDEEESIGML